MEGAVRGLGALEISMGNKNRERGNSLTSMGKSKSPHRRANMRSDSPATLDTNKAVLDDGRTIDISKAYRRLSDANLALSRGALATLSGKGRRAGRESTSSPDGRLKKDYLSIEGENIPNSSDDEQTSSDESNRGRKTGTRRSKSPADGGRRVPASQMDAVDEERMYTHVTPTVC